MVIVHVPRSGTVVVCDEQVVCPFGTQEDRVGTPGIPGILIGEVGLGVAARVKAKVASKVGGSVGVSVGVIVSVIVIVLVDVGVLVGVDVMVDVGVKVTVVEESIFFTGPQAERVRLNPNKSITEICFPMFILPPTSIPNVQIN